MILVITRTLILYLATVISLRIMGKKQIGQLQPYELVVIIMIAELATIPMENTGTPLLNGLIPIFILFTAEVTISYISMKSQKARGFICGKPSILIENAIIMEDELRRLRYNVNDLLEQLRLKDVINVEDVQFAILETSGELSVILKSQNRALQPKDMNMAPPDEVLPTTLIIDGHILTENLQRLHRDRDWLQYHLNKNSIHSVREVFFACLDSEGKFFYQLKQSKESTTS